MQLIDTMLHLASTDPGLKVRYAGIAKIKNLGNALLKADQLSNCYDKIYKEHLRAGDVQTLISAWQGNINDKVLAQEQAAQMEYYSVAGSLSWSLLALMMQSTGLAPTDAMIANFALSIEADAIVTTDLDFMQVAGVLDVFMPTGLANQAVGVYDPTID